MEVIKEDDQLEQISIEHSVIAVFVNTEDAKLGKEDVLDGEEDDSLNDILIENDEEAMKRVEKLGDMQAEDQFEVYQRMNADDFKKFFLSSIIPIGNKFSLKSLLRCNLFKKKELLFPVKISLDRLTFRHSDSSINMVIQYPN